MDEKIVKTILIEVIGDVSMIEYHQIEEMLLREYLKKMKPDTQGQSDPLFYSKIDSITSDLRREYSKVLYEISKENSLTIVNYSCNENRNKLV
jgi:hypothetical protein